MGIPGTYTYRIVARDVDFASRPTLVALTDHVLSAAGDDADRNGFGVGDLHLNNWTWVLSRFCIEFDRWPAQGDDLDVRTWVSEVGRLMTTRNFVVTDVDGEPVAAAVSNWAIIDICSRRPVDLAASFGHLDVVVDVPSPVAQPARIAAVKGGREMIHRVAYSDLDFNRHTNSMRYLALMMDMLPLERLERTPHRLDLNFLHESRYGDLLTVAVQEGDTSFFEIRNEEGAAICRAKIEWK